MPVFVNGFEISDEAIHQEMQYHPSATVELAMENAARALAIRILLLQEARKELTSAILDNLSDDDMIDLLLNKAIGQDLNETSLTEPGWHMEMRSYIRQLASRSNVIGVTIEGPLYDRNMPSD